VVLDALLPEVHSILGGQFINMYQDGSHAFGGFNVDSDADFVVVTKVTTATGIRGSVSSSPTLAMLGKPPCFRMLSSATCLLFNIVWGLTIVLNIFLFQRGRWGT
jgi:hypothetical protein